MASGPPSPSRVTSPLLVSQNEDYSATLENAANNVYEAVIENDEDYDEEEHDEDVAWLREHRLKNQELHWSKRPSVLMVSLIVFLVAFAASSGEATRQMLQYKLACNYLGVLGKDGVCDPAQVQLMISNLQMGYNVSSGIIMLVASGKIGPLSDRYGRKIFLLMVLSCIFIGKLAKLLVMLRWDTLHFGLMVATEILTFSGGGVISLITLVNCYITDVVEPHQRIYYLGMAVASVLVGTSFGPLVGNLINSLSSKINVVDAGANTFIDHVRTFLVGSVDQLVDSANAIKRSDFLPIKFEVTVLFLVWIFAVFVLPESRSERARKKSRSASISTQTRGALIEFANQSKLARFIDSINFLKPLKLLIVPTEYLTNVPPNKIRRHKIAILILLVVDCSVSAFAIVLGETSVLYGVYKFHWTSQEIGLWLAVVCSSKAIGLILLSPLLNHVILQKLFKLRVMKKQFDMIDFSISTIGLITDATVLFSIVFVRNRTLYLVVWAFSCLGPLVSPTLTSSITKYYPESKIGEVYGAMALLKNLITLVVPILLLTTYKYLVSEWDKPEYIFIMFGSILATFAVGVAYVKWLLKLDTDTVPTLTRSNSIVSFASDHSTPPTEHEAHRATSFSDIHRKSSFVNRERTIQEA